MMFLLLFLGLGLAALSLVALAMGSAAGWLLWPVAAFAAVLIAGSMVKAFWRKDFPIGLAIVPAALLLAPVWVSALATRAGAVWFLWAVFAAASLAFVLGGYALAEDLAEFRHRRQLHP